jgi:hypothetical protein
MLLRGDLFYKGSYDVKGVHVKQEAFPVFCTPTSLWKPFRYLFGEVSGVRAHIRRPNPAIMGEDTAQLLWTFESGATCAFGANRYNEPRSTALGDISRWMASQIFASSGSASPAGPPITRGRTALSWAAASMRSDATLWNACVRTRIRIERPRVFQVVFDGYASAKHPEYP